MSLNPNVGLSMNAPIAPESGINMNDLESMLQNNPQALNNILRERDRLSRLEQIDRNEVEEDEEMPRDYADQAKKAIEGDEGEDEGEDEESIKKFEDFPYEASAVQVMTAMEGMSGLGNMRYLSKISYMIYYQSRKKNDLIKMFEEKGDKKLADLIRYGAENSPVLLAVLGLKPEYFEAPAKAKEAMKLMGYNHNLSDRELTDLTNKWLSHDLLMDEGPFRHKTPFEELALQTYINKGDEIFRYLKTDEENESVARKLINRGTSKVRDPGFDYRLVDSLPSYGDVSL